MCIRDRSIARHATALSLRHERRNGVLVVAPDYPLEQNAPRVIHRRAESQLAEGNAVLGDPACAVARGGDLPHRVPRVVVLVDRLHLIAANAGGIDVESERRSMIVIAVDHHAEPVRVAEWHVASPEPGCDATGVMEPYADVERIVVVDDSDFRLL